MGLTVTPSRLPIPEARQINLLTLPSEVAAAPKLEPRQAAPVPDPRSVAPKLGVLPPPVSPMPGSGNDAEEVKQPAIVLPARAQPSPPMQAPRPSPPLVRSQQTADTAWNSYQLLLWRQVLARRPDGLHLSGEATLRFTLDMNGALIDADIARSSGNRMLDRLALRTLRNAAPFPTPPEEIRDRILTFTIRFQFNR